MHCGRAPHSHTHTHSHIHCRTHSQLLLLPETTDAICITTRRKSVRKEEMFGFSTCTCYDTETRACTHSRTHTHATINHYGYLRLCNTDSALSTYKLLCGYWAELRTAINALTVKRRDDSFDTESLCVLLWALNTARQTQRYAAHTTTTQIHDLFSTKATFIHCHSYNSSGRRAALGMPLPVALARLAIDFGSRASSKSTTKRRCESHRVTGESIQCAGGYC